MHHHTSPRVNTRNQKFVTAWNSFDRLASYRIDFDEGNPGEWHALPSQWDLQEESLWSVER